MLLFLETRSFLCLSFGLLPHDLLDSMYMATPGIGRGTRMIACFLFWSLKVTPVHSSFVGMYAFRTYLPAQSFPQSLSAWMLSHFVGRAGKQNGECFALYVHVYIA